MWKAASPGEDLRGYATADAGAGGLGFCFHDFLMLFYITFDFKA